MDDQFIELGKLYYEVLNKDNVFDEKAAPVVQKIDEINQRIESLKSSLEKITQLLFIFTILRKWKCESFCQRDVNKWSC